MTLIELLVVIAIMAVLTGIAVSFSKQSRDQILLTTEKAKIAQTIARVKSLTLAGYTKPVSQPAPCSYGFAIDYSSREYFIFEYIPPPPDDCSGIESITQINTDSSYLRKIENFLLPDGVNFNDAPGDKLSYLIFIPPNLTSHVFVNAGSKSNSALKIYLETPDKSLTKEIIVHPNGQLTL